MPDLIAQGVSNAHRWRRKIPENGEFILGRTANPWSVGWDDKISRQHVRIALRENSVRVEQLEAARNPVFFLGREQKKFNVRSGQHFVIGATTFTVSNEQVHVTLDTPSPMTEQTYQPQYLRQVRYRDADKRISVLGQLPEVIAQANNESELFVRLVNLLLSGIPRANAVAIVRVQEDDDDAVSVLQWDRRRLAEDEFQPSGRLIRQAVQTQQSIVHIWEDKTKHQPQFTFRNEGAWAFTTPLSGDASKGWAIYVTGGYSNADDSKSASDATSEDLRDDVKFTELAASTLANLRQVKLLEKQQSSLDSFFSPLVLKAFQGLDPEEVLRPREVQVSVLFCDLRGFSRASEQADNLLVLLKRVSQALGVTTKHILEFSGVVGDFHGDAAMGFWGWPMPQEDLCLRACRAALAVRKELHKISQNPDDPLYGFQMGQGIATGIAVAGKIGTVDQVKVTAFGPVVNLASRLESMTRILKSSILVDEETAKLVREQAPPDLLRVRRIAVVVPYGMDQPLEVSEILPPESEYPQLTDEHIAAYEKALDALLDRQWSEALKLLHEVPADDQVKDFLTVFIAQHNRVPPEDWNGAITLPSK